MFRLFLLLAALGLYGCAGVPVPAYAPSYQHVQQLKRAGQPLALAPFEAAPGAGRLSVRGNTLKSPYGGDFIDYIRAAFASELSKAGLLADDSDRRITCRISENSIDGSGIEEGRGRIEATFSVLAGDRVLYRETLTATHVWNSSFVGVIAVPNAAESYPALVRSLFDQLYGDAGFLRALRAPAGTAADADAAAAGG